MIIVFEQRLPICYNYSSTDAKLEFMMITCPYCVKEFLYECTLIHHIMMKHFKETTKYKRQFLGSEASTTFSLTYLHWFFFKFIFIFQNLIVKIASALKNVDNIVTSEALMMYLNSYDCRINFRIEYFFKYFLL